MTTLSTPARPRCSLTQPESYLQTDCAPSAANWAWDEAPLVVRWFFSHGRRLQTPGVFFFFQQFNYNSASSSCVSFPPFVFAALAVLFYPPPHLRRQLFFNRWRWREDSETSADEHIVIMNRLRSSIVLPENREIGAMGRTIAALIADLESLINPPLRLLNLFPFLLSIHVLSPPGLWRRSPSHSPSWVVGFRGSSLLSSVNRHEMLRVMLPRKLWTGSKRGSWKRRNTCIIARIKTVRLFFSSSSSASPRFAGMKRKTCSRPRWRKCFRRHKEVSRGKGNIETSPKTESISVLVSSCVAGRKKLNKSLIPAPTCSFQF